MIRYSNAFKNFSKAVELPNGNFAQTCIAQTNAGNYPGILLNSSIYCETANTAIVTCNVDYHEAHQKLGHPGHNTTRATALKLG